MAKTAFLSVKILADAKDASRGIDETESKLGKLQGGAEKAAAGMSVASAAVVAMGKQAFDAASNLQQSTGAVESIFKAQADAITDLAQKADQAVGLSQNSYQELASVLGAQLKNMGIAEQELVGTTDDLITKGADLAATFGGTTAEAVQALSSLMKGEADPIERYGISIKEANIEAKLAAMGLSDLEGEAGKAARTQAIFALLNEQSADAVGAFARESDTAAGQLQRANAEWENSKAALGEALLPYVSQAAQKFAELARWVGENPEKAQALAVAVLGITGVLYTVITLVKVWTAAQTLLNLALTANPIGLVIAAIAALVAGFVLAYKNCEGFRNAVDNLMSTSRLAVEETIKWISDGFNNALESVKQFFEKVKFLIKTTIDILFKDDFAGGAFGIEEDELGFLFDLREKYEEIRDFAIGTINNIKNAWNDGLNWIDTRVTATKDFFVNGWNNIKTSTTSTWNDITNGIKTGWDNAVNFVSGKVNTVINNVKNGAQALYDWITRPFQYMENGINRVVNIVQNLINKFRDLRDWIGSVAQSFNNSGVARWARATFSAPPPGFTGVTPPNAKFFATLSPTLTAAAVRSPIQFGYGRLISARPQVVNNITINGAIDPYETGRQVDNTLNFFKTRQSW